MGVPAIACGCEFIEYEKSEIRIDQLLALGAIGITISIVMRSEDAEAADLRLCHERALQEHHRVQVPDRTLAAAEQRRARACLCHEPVVAEHVLEHTDTAPSKPARTLDST